MSKKKGTKVKIFASSEITQSALSNLELKKDAWILANPQNRILNIKNKIYNSSNSLYCLIKVNYETNI